MKEEATQSTLDSVQQVPEVLDDLNLAAMEVLKELIAESEEFRSFVSKELERHAALLQKALSGYRKIEAGNRGELIKKLTLAFAQCNPLPHQRDRAWVRLFPGNSPAHVRVEFELTEWKKEFSATFWLHDCNTPEFKESSQRVLKKSLF